MTSRNRLGVSLFFVALSSPALAQQPQPAGGGGQTTQPAAGAVNQALPTGELPAQLDTNYTLGPNDQILIRAPGADDINERPFRIDSEGFLNLPSLGRIRAAGLTIHQLEAELVNRLRETIVQPQVIISVTQFRGEPVFFEGMFQRPQILNLQGRRTLREMLTAVGGLQPNASRRIKVRRHLEYGPIPLPNAIEDSEKKTSTVEISFASLRENVNPAEDIVLQPYDVVTVERAELIYVAGEIAHTGTIELGERDYLTVTQALTMSGGFTVNAKRSKVRVLRPILNTNRRAELDIDLTGIFEGKVNDFPLLPNDVLFVPRSNNKILASQLIPIGLSVINPFIYLAIR